MPDIRLILTSPAYGKPEPDLADPEVAARRDEGLKELRALLAAELGPLREREADLRVNHEEPSRAAAATRGSPR